MAFGSQDFYQVASAAWLRFKCVSWEYIMRRCIATLLRLIVASDRLQGEESLIYDYSSNIAIEKLEEFKKFKAEL